MAVPMRNEFPNDMRACNHTIGADTALARIVQMVPTAQVLAATVG
jgi:6-phosphofructokinase